MENISSCGPHLPVAASIYSTDAFVVHVRESCRLVSITTVVQCFSRSKSYLVLRFITRSIGGQGSEHSKYAPLANGYHIYTVPIIEVYIYIHCCLADGIMSFQASAVATYIWSRRWKLISLPMFEASENDGPYAASRCRAETP